MWEIWEDSDVIEWLRADRLAREIWSLEHAVLDRFKLGNDPRHCPNCARMYSSHQLRTQGIDAATLAEAERRQRQRYAGG